MNAGTSDDAVATAIENDTVVSSAFNLTVCELDRISSLLTPVVFYFCSGVQDEKEETRSDVGADHDAV